MRNNIPRDLITLEDVCELTGYTPSGWRTVRNRGRATEVRRWRVGKNVMFSRKEIVAWMEKNHARLIA